MTYPVRVSIYYRTTSGSYTVALPVHDTYNKWGPITVDSNYPQYITYDIFSNTQTFYTGLNAPKLSNVPYENDIYVRANFNTGLTEDTPKLNSMTVASKRIL